MSFLPGSARKLRLVIIMENFSRRQHRADRPRSYFLILLRPLNLFLVTETLVLSAFLSFFSRYSKRTLRMELSLRTISLTISVRAFVALIVGELCLSRVFFFRKSIEVHLKKKKRFILRKSHLVYLLLLYSSLVGNCGFTMTMK